MFSYEEVYILGVYLCTQCQVCSDKCVDMKQSMTSSDSCDSVISKDLVSDVYCLDTDSDSDQSDHEHFDR